MKQHLLSTAILAALLCGPARAQTETAPLAPTEAPNAGALVSPLTPEQKKAKEMEAIMAKAQAEGLALMKLPPDQMRARIRQIQEQSLRTELDQLGFKDKTLQDRIVAFVDEQEKSREKVRNAGTKVQTALRAAGGATTDQGLSALLEDYLGSVDDAIDEREKASAALDADIKWSRNSRLRAFLTLQGFIGEAAWLTGDVMMTGVVAMGGLGQLGATQ